MNRSIIIFSMLLVVVGCATASRLSEIRPGMERLEVIKLLGTPASTGFIDGAEYLYYRLARSGYEDYMSRGMSKQDYVVRLVNGLVDSYGHKQDVVPVRIHSGTH